MFYYLKKAENIILKSMSEEPLRRYEGHTSAVLTLAVCADGEHFVSGSWDNTLRLWNIASGACAQVYKGHTRHTRSVHAVAVCTDGEHFVSGWFDNARLWQLPDLACGFGDDELVCCKAEIN